MFNFKKKERERFKELEAFNYYKNAVICNLAISNAFRRIGDYQKMLIEQHTDEFIAYVNERIESEREWIEHLNEKRNSFRQKYRELGFDEQDFDHFENWE